MLWDLPVAKAPEDEGGDEKREEDQGPVEGRALDGGSRDDRPGRQGIGVRQDPENCGGQDGEDPDHCRPERGIRFELMSKSGYSLLIQSFACSGSFRRPSNPDAPFGQRGMTVGVTWVTRRAIRGVIATLG